MQDGAELAEWVINTKLGGIGDGGSTIELLIQDTATDPTTSAAAATSLVEVDDVEAIVGAAGSTNTLAIAAVTNPAQVVLISYASTNPNITTQGGEYTFRVVGSDNLQGQAMSDVALEFGYKKAVSLVLSNAYGLGLADVFKTNFEAGGGTIVKEIPYTETATSFSTEITEIKTLEDAGDIDCIMDVSYASDGAIIFTEAATEGIETPWVCAEGVADAEIFEEKVGVGAAMEGMWGTKPYSDTTTTEYAQFLAYFHEKYGASENPKIYADTSYDAVMLLADAIADAGDYDGTAIKNSLQTVSQGWKGATGDKSFDANGDVGQDYSIWRVEANASIAVGYEFATHGYWTLAGGADFEIPETEEEEDDGIAGFEAIVLLVAFGISASIAIRRRKPE
jgi:branched-chain amino acid transport system substrate-binding protein